MTLLHLAVPTSGYSRVMKVRLYRVLFALSVHRGLTGGENVLRSLAGGSPRKEGCEESAGQLGNGGKGEGRCADGAEEEEFRESPRAVMEEVDEITTVASYRRGPATRHTRPLEYGRASERDSLLHRMQARVGAAASTSFPLKAPV